MRVLLVEDSHTLQRSLSTGLRNSGYAIDQAFDGLEAKNHLACTRYDVVILDIMIPKLDGLALLKQLRQRGNNTPVLILSARDSTEDRIQGLDIGADDYLVKPFSFEELLSRLRALIRRTQVGSTGSNPVLTLHDITINTIERVVRVNDQPILLTPHEYKILELLVRRKGQVFNHDQMIDRLYSSDHSVTRNTIEVHVSSLRRKLRTAGADELILTRRGYGYYVSG